MMGRDRDRDRDWGRDWDRNRDRGRDRDLDRSRDRGGGSRARPAPAPLRKPTSEAGPRHSSSGGHAPPPSRHLWIGNLAPAVSERILFEEFRRFGEVESINYLPGRSYAFVNFSKEEDAVKALRALQGTHIAGSPVKIEFSKGDMEPSEILWIGFPSSLNVDENALRTVFSSFGEIVRIATFPGRSYAFVHYHDVASASRARETLNGKLFNNPRVHISFARSDVAVSEVARSGTARRSPPRDQYRKPDFEGRVSDFHSGSMSPCRRPTFDRPNLEPTRRGSRSSPFDEGYGLPPPHRRRGSDYDDPYHFPPPSERRRVAYPDDPYPLSPPPYERRRGLYPEDLRPLPPPVERRWVPESDDRYPLHKRMRASPDAIGDMERELPEYPFNELSRGRSNRFSPLNEGFGGIRAGPGQGVYDVNMGKLEGLNANRPMMKEVWKWEGVIAKGGATVCQARCFPVGKTLDFMLPEILNCSARTNLEMLSEHYYRAAASWVVFFAPGSDSDIVSYNDFMHYLTEKQRVAVVKLEEKITLFLVPPSDFSEKVLKVPGKLSISGLILRFHQQMDTDTGRGLTFERPVSNPGRRIEESSNFKAHDSHDFPSHVRSSSDNFNLCNYSSDFTPPHLPPNPIQQQSHEPGTLGFTLPRPPNPIQKQTHEPGYSGFAPLPPNPVQQQVHELGTSVQQQVHEFGTSGSAPPQSHNLLQQHNLELGPTGFSHPAPPYLIQQQNLEPGTSGFAPQPPSNPTWQQAYQPVSTGGYNPFQNNNLSGNFQLRSEFPSNYITAPPPLPPGPPPPRVSVPPSISQPVSMPYQFSTNHSTYEQGSLEQNPSSNPNPNVNPTVNSVLLPSYTSQAPHVPSGMWGLPVSHSITSVPSAAQQQQQVGGGAGGLEGENAAEPDQQKRLQATMQLAAVLLQQMQQKASTTTDRR